MSLDQAIEDRRTKFESDIEKTLREFKADLATLRLLGRFPMAYETLLVYVDAFEPVESGDSTAEEFILNVLMPEDQGDGVLRFEIDYEHYHWDASTLKWVCRDEEDEDEDDE